MKIIKDFETEVIESYDEENDCIDNSAIESFKKDEVLDVDIVSENEENIHVQFGDGSVAFFPKDCVECA